MKKAALIYNPVAGRRRASRESQIRTAAAALRTNGMEVELAETTASGSGREIAQAEVKRGCDLILVSGGDGTINEVANGLVLGDVPLGILPAGTANTLARELGLPRDPVRAAVELLAWSPRRIAMGRVTWPSAQAQAAGAQQAAPPHSAEQRYFLSVAGVGFDAYIVKKLATHLKLSLGVAAYVLEGLRQSLRYSFPPFICEVDGREFPASFAVVHRTSRYAGWLRMAPSADIFAPRFQLCLFKSGSRARYFLYTAAVVARQHLKLRDVEIVQATKIVCPASDSGKAVYIELDGELAGQLPATFEVVPDALTLLVP